jgi:hypothetical protein
VYQVIGGRFGAMFGFAEVSLPCKTQRVQEMGRKPEL